MAVYAWRVLSGDIATAANYIDVTTNQNPATSAPGAADIAEFIVPSELVTGSAAFGAFDVFAGVATFSTFRAQVATGPANFDNGTSTFNMGGTLTASNGIIVGQADGLAGTANAPTALLEIDSGSSATLTGGAALIGYEAGATGTLIVGTGGTFTSTVAPTTADYVLKAGGGTSGAVVVQGPGASLNLGNAAGIGLIGSGSLTVTAGGAAAFATTDPTTLAALSVGRGGTGTVTVSDNGSSLSLAGAFYAGRASGSSGTVTIANNATLTETAVGPSDLSVIGGGANIGGTFATGGTGTLNVDAGATASLGGGLAAGLSGATGVIDVGGGTLNVGGSLLVGAGSAATGGSGTLTISDHGAVHDTGAANAAGYQHIFGFNGNTGAVTVTGGSTLDGGRNATVIGYSGRGSLTVEAGSTASSASADSTMVSALEIGRNAGAQGTLSVADSPSSYSAQGFVGIGEAGTGTLIVNDGGSFTGGQAATGNGMGANAAFTLAIGAGNAVLNASGAMNTPLFGGTGTATVENGSSLVARASLRIGYRGSNGTLTLATGSTAQAATIIYVGSGTDRSGAVGTVLVGNGSTLKSLGPHTTGSASVSIGVDPSTTGTLTVMGAGATLDSGGDRITVGSSGTGSLNVLSGGVARSGNTLYAAPSAESGLTIGGNESGTGAVVVDGAGSMLTDNGEITVGGSATASGGTGGLTITNAGQVSGTSLTLYAGGTITTDATGLLTVGSTAGAGAGVDVLGAATLTAHGGRIAASVANAGTLTDDGALTVTGSVTGAGAISLLAGSAASIGGAITGQSVSFGAAGLTLTLGQLSGAATVAADVETDAIDLRGVTDAVVSGGSVGNGSGSIAFTALAPGDALFLSSDNAGGTLVTVNAMPCYCPGTLILTDRGEVAVEALAIGDRVIVGDGRAEPIRWIGRRSYAGRFLAGRADLHPVRFSAGSLGAGLPRRDLRVSPLHAMLIDGVLVPAGLLVNDATIVQEADVREVRYIHVELARHETVWAEGAASETFVDDGGRGVFHNAGEYAALYPGAVAAPPRYCAPRVETGEALDVIRARLGDGMARAA